MASKKEFDFFDKPENIRKLWGMLYVFCGLTLLPDFFLHAEGHFTFDGFFGFHGLLGFVACVVLILFAKLVGLVLKVKENYYDK